MAKNKKGSGPGPEKIIPAASKLTAPKTEAPMLVTRPVQPKVVEVAPPQVIEAAPVARTEIARLAFAKFVARGYVHGHAVNDWLSAESELRATAN